MTDTIYLIGLPIATLTVAIFLFVIWYIGNDLDGDIWSWCFLAIILWPLAVLLFGVLVFFSGMALTGEFLMKFLYIKGRKE